MADENVLAPAPTRSDDQILPFAAWVPIGKSNFVLGLQKKQKNPIFQISVDILQNTNFFRAFTASASVPAICIQQFWNTLTYEAKTGAYSFQLDESQFVLDANLLREALEITPIDQSHQFVSPPSGDAIMDFVNELGYTKEIHFVSRMAVNNLTNVDYAELMWEEFVQAIQTFLTDKANLDKKGKKDKPHFVPKGEDDEVFGMSIPNDLITNNIRNAPYYNAYLEMVAKHDQKIAAEKGGKKKPATAKQLKPKHVKEKSSKPAPEPKPKVTQVKPAKPSPAKHSKMDKVQKIRKGKSSLQLIDKDEPTQPEPEPEHQAHVGGVAIREPIAEATQPLPVVKDKGKEIATEEQAAQSLLALHTPKRRSADTDKTNSGGDTKILQIDEEQVEDVDNQANLEEKTIELDQGQAGSDPGSTQPLASQSSAWKTSDTREAPSSSSRKKSAPYSEQPVEDVPIPDDLNISDSEDTDIAHLPKIKTKPDWLKPVLEEDKLATPEPDWVIPPNELPETKNTWANALARSVSSCCHRSNFDLVNPEGHRVVPYVSKPLPLGGPPGQVTIQTQYFFNKDLEYLVSGDKGRRSALSISKLKAAQYLDFSFEESSTAPMGLE
ncbi:hypothetical protein Tco_0733163 [Tanacetum coccineum]